MNIKIHSSELNRMMKTIVQCIDPKSQTLGNIEVIYDNNLLTIRGTDGTFSAVMSTPLLGGDGETFCVDGTMFARVVGMCSGEVNLITDGKTCTVKGAGRTRLPVVNTDIPAFDMVEGKKISVSANDFSRCFSSVAYAISNEQNRPVLTGSLVTVANNRMEMTALDGFQMAIEYAECSGDEFTAVIPGAFLKLISAGVSGNENVSITVNKGKVQAETDGMMISCSLLSGDFPDVQRILPQSFATESVLNSAAIINALKSGSVVNAGNNLVKLDVSQDKITIMSNSEQADFDADVTSETQGNGLMIAFNQKYLMNTINSISSEDIVMKFNSSINPCIVQGRNLDGIHLVLPVRVKG